MNIETNEKFKEKFNTLRIYKNKGISLIVLIITIIVIVILAGTVILSLSTNNPIASAQLAANLSEAGVVQTSLDLYMLSNMDLNGHFTKYPLGANVVSSDLNVVMRERVAIGQEVSLSEDIDYSSLFFLNRSELGINNIRDKIYFIDTKNAIVYINNGLELANGMAYVLTEAARLGTQTNQLVGTAYAEGNNTYVVKDTGDMYSVGETGLYNPMLLPISSVYDINTQPQKVDIGYEVGDKIYKEGTTTIVLKVNGDVYGLGGNTKGELGLGDTYPRYSLTKLPLSNIKEIYSTSGGTVFALENSGTLLAAGYNVAKVIKNTNELQIMQFTNITYNLDGSTTNKISNITNVSATSSNVYLELANGQLWAWGENEFNVLDTTSGDGLLLPIRKTEIENLKTVTGSTIIKMASGSSQCNFVLLANGGLYAKGYGGYDGVPGSTNTTVYTKIFDNVKDVSTGGTTSSLLDNIGDTYAWGNNATYSMGLDTATTYYVPTKLNISNIKEITRTTALSNDGKLYNIGKTEGIFNKEIENIPQMLKVYSQQVSIDASNKLWLCGNNVYGQLLVADKGSKNILVKANISNMQSIKSGGSNYIALTKDGKLFGAGANVYNQITSASTNNIVDVTQISFAGTVIDYDLSERNLYFIDSSNDLWEVGNSSYGQMGETGAKTIPTKFTAQILKFSKVFAENRVVMALTTDGKLYACGQDDNGEIGLGAGTGVFGSSRITKFTQIISDNNLSNIDFSKLVKVEIGGNFSVLLMNDGSVYSTGINIDGQLGLNDNNFRSRWTKNTFFDSISKVIDIGVGPNFTTFLLANGDVYTTGNNSYGQFGNSTKTSSNIPIKANISNVKKISVGAGHVVVTKNDGTAWSYGKGSHGQLGNGNIAQDISIPKRAYELEK
jgi:alpha-tubulin suppressor-like RCC1 family protein